MSGRKNKPNAERDALKAIKFFHSTNHAVEYLEKIIKVLPNLVQGVRSGTLSLPILLGNNITADQFCSLCQKYEQPITRRLTLLAGSVTMHELFRGAHERVLRIISRIISDACDQISKDSVAELGACSVRIGDCSCVQPDTSFEPTGVTSTATLLVEVLDSERVSVGIEKARKVLRAADNHVQVVLLVKLLRWVRPAASPAPMLDLGFVDDVIPGKDQIDPVSEMIFILMRRCGDVSVVRTGLGPPPLAYVLHDNDNLDIQLPGVAVLGANPGPFAAHTLSVVIPWQDVYFTIPPSQVPQDVASGIAAAASNGIVIDPHTVWRLLGNEMRYAV